MLHKYTQGGTVAALIAIQKPEVIDGIIFSSPALLHSRGTVVVCWEAFVYCKCIDLCALSSVD